MATPEQIQAARELLQQKWMREGECGSCGWHALLSEHDVEDFEIEEALDGSGILEISCVSRDDDESWGHRGVKIDLRARP